MDVTVTVTVTVACRDGAAASSCVIVIVGVVNGPCTILVAGVVLVVYAFLGTIPRTRTKVATS